MAGLKFIQPMRPGLRFTPGAWPSDWSWQIKVDEERGVYVPGEGLFNRHGELLSRPKAAAFTASVRRAAELFPDMVLDLGLVGFRNSKAFAAHRGRLIVFDLPGVDAPWSVRRLALGGLPEFYATAGQMVCRLDCYACADICLDRARKSPGAEGVVGRRLTSVYQPGDSAHMGKYRFQ